MPEVNNYTLETLQAAIISATEEDEDFSDLFVAELPHLIRKGESRCYEHLNFEIFDRSRTGSLTPSVNLQPIKGEFWQGTRFIYLRAVGGTGPRYYLEKRSHSFCIEYDADDPTLTSRPLYFAEADEENIYVVPPPDVAYVYEIKEIRNDESQSLIDLDPLEADSTWLSRNCASALFAACMIEAETWLQADQPVIEQWQTEFMSRLSMARTTLRENIRTGDYTPMQDAAKTVEESK